MLRKILLAFLLTWAGAAYAGNSTLSNLASGNAISNADLFYDVQSIGAGGVKVTGTQLSTFIFGKVSGSCTATSSGVFTCSGGGGGSPGGSNTQLQYNNSSAFGGISGATSNGTAVTFASGDFKLSGSSSGTATLNAPSTGGGTATLFAGSDTIVGLGQTQTFTGVNTFGTLKVAVRSASTSTVTVSATTDYFLCLDPTSNTIAVDLPSSPATGLTYLVKDCTGQANANNITITPNAGNIDGSSTYVLTTAYQSVSVTYTGSQWSIN